MIAPAVATPAIVVSQAGAPAHASPFAASPLVVPGKPALRGDAPAGRGAAAETQAQQAFIDKVAGGAVAAQRRYGIPAAVTIAQAIEESGWGRSGLAARYNNLFGIKGAGPAGSVLLPTQVYERGQWVTTDAPFRVYHDIAESIADHAELLASSGYYQRAMAHRAVPDEFANDLTGIYATDPDYGTKLITLMQLYDLYRYDVPPPPAASHAATHPAPPPAPAPVPGVPAQHARPGLRPSPRRHEQAPAHAQPLSPRPQPAQPGGQGWEQFTLTMFGIPILVNLFSSVAYERLKKKLHSERPTKFQFLIVRDDGNVIDAFVDTDDGEAARQVIKAFSQLVGPGRLVTAEG